jgi:hypothetical protein
LREFDGWVPERVTEYEHDGDGRLVRSVEYVESPWDEHQRGLMIALGEWEAARCPECGGDRAECQDPAADINNPYGTWVYEGTLVECHRGSAARRVMPESPERRSLIPLVTKRRRGTPSSILKR